MKHSTDLEALIDDVAHGMTSGHAPRMRARVLVRLTERRSARPMFWAMGAVATAACAAMVFVNLRMAPTAPVAPQAVAHPALGARRSALATTEHSASGDAPRLRAERNERQPNAQRLAPSAPSPDQLAWQAAAVPVLEPLKLLTLESIQPERLEVRPLTMAPLDIPLLGAEDE